MNVLPILIIGLVAALLAFDKRYEDGLVRHVALAGIVTSSVIIVLYQWFGDGYEYTWEMTIFLYSCMVFISCHGFSYIRWRLTGDKAWSKHVAEE